MAERRPGPWASEDNVADHIRLHREMRGWSTAHLAREVTAAGVPLSQSAVWRIESGNPRRKISVDELIGFAKVFGVSIGELLEPLSVDYPPDLVRLYVNRYVDTMAYALKAEFRASLVGHNLGRFATRFPQADSEIREMITERVSAMGGDEDMAAQYVSMYSMGLDPGFPRDIEQLSPAEFIILGRAQGHTDEELIDMAQRWGFRQAVEEALKLGVVHFIEPDFAGWMPLAFLEIRDGRVTRSAAAGRAAQAAAEQAAKDGGLSDIDGP